MNQEFFDENRERFQAETTKMEADHAKSRCSHSVSKQKSLHTVECPACLAGWTFSSHAEAQMFLKSLQT